MHLLVLVLHVLILMIFVILRNVWSIHHPRKLCQEMKGVIPVHHQTGIFFTMIMISVFYTINDSLDTNCNNEFNDSIQNRSHLNEESMLLSRYPMYCESYNQAFSHQMNDRERNPLSENLNYYRCPTSLYEVGETRSTPSFKSIPQSLPYSCSSSQIRSHSVNPISSNNYNSMI